MRHVRLERWPCLLAVAAVVASPVHGCGPAWQPPAVGTCVRASDTGEVIVPCTEPHTHRVAAVVPGDGTRCPGETVMYATPADPHVEPQVTVCYVLDQQRE